MLILAACGSGSGDKPTPEPTLTPQPALQGSVDSTLLEAVKVVCDGQGIPEAASYNPQVEGVHPVIVVDMTGNQEGWWDDPPAEWQPSRIEEVELVVCVHDRIKYRETCHYEQGGTRTRYDREITVELYRAQTGALVDQMISTVDAPWCPQQIEIQIGGEGGDPLHADKIPAYPMNFPGQRFVWNYAYIADPDFLAALPGTLLSWLPDGQVLSVASGKTSMFGNLAIVDPRTGIISMELETVEGSENKLVVVSPNGQYVASQSDNSVYVWQVNQPERSLRVFFGIFKEPGLAWSPDGNTLLTAPEPRDKGSDWLVRGLRLWDPQAGTEPEPLRVIEVDETVGSQAIYWLPDGVTVVSLSMKPDWRAVTFIDLETGTTLQTIDRPGFHESAALSPDGATLAVSHSPEEGQVWLIDTATRAIRLELTGPTSTFPYQLIPVTLRFSPKGTWIYHASLAHTVRVWEVETGELLNLFDTPPYSVAFDPTETYLAYVDGSRDIIVLRIETGEEVARIDTALRQAWIDWSPDGTLFVTRNIGDFRPAQYLTWEVPDLID